ncbi:MAG: hypothetical protein ACRC5C_06375 [Bacilli bacterium]
MQKVEFYITRILFVLLCLCFFTQVAYHTWPNNAVLSRVAPYDGYPFESVQ